LQKISTSLNNGGNYFITDLFMQQCMLGDLYYPETQHALRHETFIVTIVEIPILIVDACVCLSQAGV